MTMKVRIKLVENVCLLAESGSGHTMVMDGSPDIGGRNIGMRPMETLLISLGGCSAMDVLYILRKQRQTVTDCVVEVEGERREEVPAIFTRIHLHFIVTGHELKESQVKRAVDLSAEKYCSVSVMLGHDAEITHDYRVMDAQVPVQ